MCMRNLHTIDGRLVGGFLLEDLKLVDLEFG